MFNIPFLRLPMVSIRIQSAPAFPFLPAFLPAFLFGNVAPTQLEMIPESIVNCQERPIKSSYVALKSEPMKLFNVKCILNATVLSVDSIRIDSDRKRP